MEEGCAVGSTEGLAEGAVVGLAEGRAEGAKLGGPEGDGEGKVVGTEVVGMGVGRSVSCMVGTLVGPDVGM